MNIFQGVEVVQILIPTRKKPKKECFFMSQSRLTLTISAFAIKLQREGGAIL